MDLNGWAKLGGETEGRSTGKYMRDFGESQKRKFKLEGWSGIRFWWGKILVGETDFMFKFTSPKLEL